MATEQFITDFETQMKRLEEINIKRKIKKN